MKTKKIILISFIVILLMIVIGCWIGQYTDMANRVLVIKIKPIALIFSHGNYDNTLDLIGQPMFYHYIVLNNKDIVTSEYLDVLKYEGYNYIYLTACRTRDSKIVYQSEAKTIYWDDYKQ